MISILPSVFSTRSFSINVNFEACSGVSDVDALLGYGRDENLLEVGIALHVGSDHVDRRLPLALGSDGKVLVPLFRT